MPGVGINTGGTSTDVVIADANPAIISLRVSSSSDVPAETIAGALEEAAGVEDVLTLGMGWTSADGRKVATT